MSKLRPEACKSTDPAMNDADVLYWIKRSVEEERGLIHGRLHSGGMHCAMGSFWARYQATVHTSLVDEVAAINDMNPKERTTTRRRRVLEWIEWKLKRVKP
jgi:hypothetical protein